MLPNVPTLVQLEHTLPICSYSDGSLGCFHLEAIRNEAGVNVCVQGAV